MRCAILMSRPTNESPTKMTRHIRNLLPLALLLASCSNQKPVVVGSMNGTEQRLLAEIVAQHLEHRLEGVEIRRRFAMGDTPILYQALLSGQVSVYPEYTGAIVSELLKEEVAHNPQVVFQRARQEMARLSRVDVLDLLGFDARFVFVVPASEAAGIVTVGEAANGPHRWTAAVPLEYQARSDGLPNFNAYRLPLSAGVKGLQPEQLFPAMTRGEVNMIVAAQTDSHLTQPQWKILDDDRNLNSNDQATLLVSQDTLQKQPKLKAALEELSGKITLEAMRKLNAEVDLNERPVPDVAKEFLKAIGL